ncbi:nicotinamide riboside transporter PnuC [Fructilactobacillus sanfranciscensis]|uniref:Nicotinamide mononucleotide transporter n=1 Tax=Fructilactobacillus sanfranciscensis TaxID=1625 RepID=A0A5C4TIV3_FRUSA|nr:nicotinamide riboside transporter PnuC [Fructilactobacillus sanfranciscensis]TNK90456.1 nicotinamide mononucleotide transporter [Fructilactobacillus sanfranciscensis]TNL00352.1 nicotinamide mononucleotide transporter [Fructilactobacillus sanfranciscensis]
MFDSYKRVLTNLPEYSHNIFRKGYFSWLLGQLKGWSKISYTIVAVNFLLQCYILATTISLPGMLWPTIFGFFGSNLAVLCVCGISNRSAINGWAGLLSAIFIITSAAIAHNWANVVEQLIYAIFLDLFCILDPKWENDIHAESFKSWLEWFEYIAFFAVAWAVIYSIFSLTNDANLFWDSLTLALALTGSLLELNLKKEQYIPWILGNVTAICLWFASMKQGTASPALFITYMIFFINSLTGMKWWYSEAKARENK